MQNLFTNGQHLLTPLPDLHLLTSSQPVQHIWECLHLSMKLIHEVLAELKTASATTIMYNPILDASLGSFVEVSTIISHTSFKPATAN